MVRDAKSQGQRQISGTGMSNSAPESTHPWTWPICIPIPEPNPNPEFEFQVFYIPVPIPIPVSEIQEHAVNKLLLRFESRMNNKQKIHTSTLSLIRTNFWCIFCARAMIFSDIAAVTGHSRLTICINGTLSVILTECVPWKLFSFWTHNVANVYCACDIFRNATIISICLIKISIISTWASMLLTTIYAFVTTNSSCNKEEQSMISFFQRNWLFSKQVIVILFAFNMLWQRKTPKLGHPPRDILLSLWSINMSICM